MSKQQMHPAQGSILRTLRYTDSARYNVLRKPTGLESDVFKFHLRNMTKTGYVEKLQSGEYALTVAGKEFANNLDDAKTAIQKQPKLSVRLVIGKIDRKGQKVYLFQRRTRNPYLGYWGSIGGPVQWGEATEKTAQKELIKQTGLTATCTVKSFFRVRDYIGGSKQLLEDKLFIIVDAANIQGTLANTWPGGFNKWMTLDDLDKTKKHYASTRSYTESVTKDTAYYALDLHYKKQDY
jgi:hypothetical protein